ncbi:MAG: SurA N-terminal domain-containing protein [Alphaproteobacteria bacterium]|nr:SurA N-terminal domain-containing protein [Alphaproteobacteria bacterium]
MRAGTDSFFIQAVFVVIIVSFVFWGVGGDGQKSQTVAQVNGQRITDTEYQRVLLRVVRSQPGALSEAQETQLRGQVLDSLIEKEVMLQEAERLGLAISDDEVKRDIFKTDAFKDSDGKFSMELYENILGRSGISRASYETEVYERLLMNRLQDMAVSAVRISEAELRQAYVSENTTVGLQYVVIPELAVLGSIEIPQEDIDALIAQDPERIKAAYDAQFERRFNTPRKALISTILLRTDIGEVEPEVVKARLEAIAAGLAPGEAFEAAARTWSEDLSAVSGGNLGNQIEEQLDPVVAEAVFATPAGQLTSVIETNRGFQVLWVRELTEAVVTPLEEAQATLARELLQQERASAVADELAEQLLADWKAEGAPPMDTLASKGLMPESVPDLKLSEGVLRALGPAPEIFAALEDAQAGAVLPKVYTVAGQRVLVQVANRTDADMGAFEDDSNLLRQRMLYTRQIEFIQDWRDALIGSATIERYL